MRPGEDLMEQGRPLKGHCGWIRGATGTTISVWRLLGVLTLVATVSYRLFFSFLLFLLSPSLRIFPSGSPSSFCVCSLAETQEFNSDRWACGGAFVGEISKPEVLGNVVVSCVAVLVLASSVLWSPVPKCPPAQSQPSPVRRTDRRSGSAPDLRVQTLPAVEHRPGESVLLRFTVCFHPLSSSWIKCDARISKKLYAECRVVKRHEYVPRDF